MRLSALTRIALAAAASLALLSGCATYSDDLQRGVRYYDENAHERALAIFRSLEQDVDSLKPEDRVRYFYYRGMTDYRLTTEKYDVSADARHWLGLAKAGEEETPSSLSEEQTSRLKETLGKLNRKVYGEDAAVDEPEEKSDKKKGDDDEGKKKGDKKKGDDDDGAKKKSDKKKGDDDDGAKKKKKKGDD